MFGSAYPVNSTAGPTASANQAELKLFMAQISSETNYGKPGEIIVNSILDSSDTSDSSGSWFKYNHSYLTRTCFIPCLLTLLGASVILIILIKRYTRETLVLYYSVLVYAVCQVLLFLVIVLDMALAAQSLSSLLYCKIASAVVSGGDWAAETSSGCQLFGHVRRDILLTGCYYCYHQSPAKSISSTYERTQL